MTNRLEHTYALLIGMDRLGDETFAHLSTTGEANAQALHSIIVGEDRCAYKLKNVISILGEEATRQNIINGFFELEDRLRADGHAEKTALIYFSGFEIKNPEGVAPTYLIPHDVVPDIGGLFRSALNVNMLSGLIQSLSPSNLLFVSDSENISLSGEGVIERPIPDPPPPPEEDDDTGIGSKPIPDPPPPPEEDDDTGIGSKPIPDPPPPPEEDDDTGIGSKPIPDPPPPPEEDDDTGIGSKPIPNPAASLGQTLLFSTSGDENSLVLHPHGISTFTWHLMEALSGYSDFARDGRTMVTAHEVWDYLRTKVPDTATQMGQTQTPVGLSNEIDFPVGLLLGGRGLQGGQPETPVFGQVNEDTLTRSSGTSPFENRVSISPEGKVYALLIGVNRYDYFRTVAGEFNLTGCVRDSEEVERFLKESVADPQERLHIRKLRSIRITEQHRSIATAVTCAQDEGPFPATRENVFAAFEEFLGQAGENDTIFIHFSGHGSFEFRPSEVFHLAGSSMDLNRGGVIMVQDSFIDREGERIYPISDLEMRWLLSNLPLGAHILSAMDCCYAGDITRNFNEDAITVRFANPPEIEEEVDDVATLKRPINSYAFYEQNKDVLDQDDTSDFAIPQTPGAVSLQACRENELSKEALFPEGKFGVFTYYFLQVLRASAANISYRDLAKLVRARVKAKAGISFQSPILSASEPDLVNLGFFSTEVVDNMSLYLVRPTSDTEAIMDAGSLHGLAALSTGTTFVDIYPHDQDIDEANPDNALKGRLTTVEAHRSKISLDDGQNFPEGTALMKAIITLSPIPPTRVKLGVAIGGEERELADLSDEQRSELEAAQALLRTSLEAQFIPLAQEAGPNEGFQFRLVANLNGDQSSFYLRRREDTLPLATLEVGAGGFTADMATIAIEQLQHVTRWDSTLKLENEQPHKIHPSDVEIVVLDAGTVTIKADKLEAYTSGGALAEGDFQVQEAADIEQALPADNGEVVLEMRRNEDGDWVVPRVRLRVKMNKEDKHYHAGFVGLQKDLAMMTRIWLPASPILGVRRHVEDQIELEEGQMQYDLVSGDINPNGQLEAGDTWHALDFYLSPTQINSGIDFLEDHLKLIVSTEEFDPSYLEQASLAMHSGTKNISQKEPANQLEEFLLAAGGGTRNFGVTRSQTTPSQTSDWYATTLTIKTVLVNN